MILVYDSLGERTKSVKMSKHSGGKRRPSPNGKEVEGADRRKIWQKSLILNITGGGTYAIRH
jgi:hypothetical protein